MLIKRPAEFRRALGEAASRGAALVYGTDAGLARERADALAALIADPADPFAATTLGDASSGVDEEPVEAELRAFSLTGGRRLVRLRFRAEAAGAADRVQRLLERRLAGEFGDQAFLLIETGALKSKGGLAKLAEQSPACLAVACWEPEPRELAQELKEMLDEGGVRLTSEALHALAGRLPSGHALRRREMERLSLFLGAAPPQPVDVAALEPFWGVEHGLALAQAAAAAFGGRLEPALAATRRAVRQGESGVTAIRSLGAHLGRLRKLKTLLQQGEDARRASRAAGVFWRDEADTLRQTRAWSGAALDEAQAGLLEADSRCKRAGSPDDLIAERAVLTIAERARRLGL